MKNKISWVYNNLALSFFLGMQILALLTLFAYVGNSIYQDYFPEQKDNSAIVYTPPSSNKDVKGKY